MPQHNATARAMMMMIVAMLALPCIDAIAKWLSGSISSGQVTWSRFFFQIILMTPLLLRTSGPWFTPALWLHAARGALIAFATLFFFSGLAYLPLADAIAKGSQWTVTDPVSVASAGGQTLTKQPDLTVLASGDNPAQDTYAIVLKGAGKVTGFRLETLAHDGRRGTQVCRDVRRPRGRP